MKRGSYNYSQFIGLQDNQQVNPESLWKQQKNMSRKSSYNQTIKKTTAQPILLQSAVAHIRYDRKRQQSDAISDLDSMYSSNFILSRENTPIKVKQKNKHRTITSQLFDIESQNEGANNQQNQLSDLVLQKHYIGLSELLYSEVVGREKKINPKLIHAWKDCLMHQDKTQIYGQSAVYSQSRVFPVSQLQKGFNQIYGSGRKRCMRIGEESILMYEMEKYLQRCSKQYSRIGRKDYDILTNILYNAKLTQLQNYTVCMKQVQLLWKILATFWRYSGKLDPINDRQLEGALVNGRSNFIDLSKDTPVTKYILYGSNIDQIINR